LIKREHSHRTERIGDLIRQEVGRLLEREVKDPRIGFVTVTRVDVTRDLRSARVGVTVLGDEQRRKAALEGLAAAQGFLRRELAHRLDLRHTPALEFFLDRMVEAEERVEELLRQIREKP
jgi:ribosome-binding factor A